MDERLKKQLDFSMEIDKEKNIFRQTHLSGHGRNENDAFTIHSFIVKTIQYYRKIKQLVPDNLMKEILEYYYSARRRFNLEQSIIRRNMLMCIYQYLDKHNKIYDYNLSIEQDELLYVTRRVGNTKVNYEILDLL